MIFDMLIIEWDRPALLWGLWAICLLFLFYQTAAGHKRIFWLPSLHLVQNLQNDFPQTAHLHLWHLLIRVMIIAAFICLCAGPSLQKTSPSPTGTDQDNLPSSVFDWQHLSEQYSADTSLKTVLIMPVLGGFSAHSWPKARQVLRQFLNQPESRTKQYLFPHTSSPRILSARDLITELDAFSPSAWPANWDQATQRLKRITPQPDLVMTLTSSHLFAGSQSAYQDYHHIFRQKWPKIPHLFLEVSTANAPVMLWRNPSAGMPEMNQEWQLAGPITAQHHIDIYAKQGGLLGKIALQSQQYSFSLANQPIPLSEIASLSLRGPGSDHAAARYILPPAPQTPLTYIIQPDHWFKKGGGKRELNQEWQAESENLVHLLEDEIYYWITAFRNHARLQILQSDDLLSDRVKRPDLLLLPTDLLYQPTIRRVLTNWMTQGSLIVITANHKSPIQAAQPSTELLLQLAQAPKRFFSGKMSGLQPPKSVTFMPETPLSDLQNVINQTMSRVQNFAPLWQALPTLSPTRQSQIWAQFEDGSPFLSFFPAPNQQKTSLKGGILFAHISADPQASRWSLSPLFPKMAEAITRMVRHVSATDQADFAFPLYQEISANGHISPVTSSSAHLALPRLFMQSEAKLSDLHALKPGLYGRQDYWQSLMAGDVLWKSFPEKHPRKDLSLKRPVGAETVYHLSVPPDQQTWPITEILILILAGLLLLDFAFSLNWQKSLPAVIPVAVLGIVSLGLIPAPLQAQQSFQAPDQLSPDQLSEAASQMRLGYLSTDQMTASQRQHTEEALLFLTYLLNQKTALELAPPHPVNPNQDILSPYPFLYWAIDAPDIPDLTARGQRALHHYLQNDGVLFIDWLAALSHPSRKLTDFLHSFLQKMGQAPLRPIPENHVLQHSFYLLSDPGDGNLWGGLYPSPDLLYSPYPNQNEQDLTSLIVGQNNWAQAWSLQWSQTLAQDMRPKQLTTDQAYQNFLNQQVFAQFAPTDRENLYQEQSNRFGINLVIFALMGLYKADQVHIPTLLKRGQNDQIPSNYFSSPQPLPLLPSSATPERTLQNRQLP